MNKFFLKTRIYLLTLVLSLCFVIPSFADDTTKEQKEEIKIINETVIGSWWNKVYYPYGHKKIKSLKKGTLIYFENKDKAEAAGFKAGKGCYTTTVGQLILNTTNEYNVSEENLSSIKKINIEKCKKVYCWQIVDPQTIIVKADGKALRIRILGVTHINKDKKIVRSISENAKLYLENKILSKWIYLAFDKYWYDTRSRIPAYILTETRELINIEMLENGIALFDDEINFHFYYSFKKAMNNAIRKGKVCFFD